MSACKHCGDRIGEVIVHREGERRSFGWVHADTLDRHCEGPIPGVWPRTSATPKGAP